MIEKKVVPKQYATETIVYAPNAESIITDKDDNIYYIQDGKVMIYKNGLTSVFADKENYLNIDCGDVKRTSGNLISIIYDEKHNLVLGIIYSANGNIEDSIVILKPVSTPVIKCKKTPVKKCSFLAIRNVM